MTVIFITFCHQDTIVDKETIAFSDVMNEDFIILDEHFVHLKAFQHLNDQHHHAATPFFKLMMLIC